MRIGTPAGRRERADPARRHARRSDDLGRSRHAHLRRAGGDRDLRRVGAPVAGHERQHRPVVADEDERLHDLVEIAADRLGSALRRGGGRRELLQPRLGARGAKEDGDTLDGLGP